MRELVMPDLDLIKQAKQGGWRRSERPIPALSDGSIVAATDAGFSL